MFVSIEDDEGKSFKDKKKDKLKASAGQSHNWNTLFLGQNAVAEIVAETYNISKQEVPSYIRLYSTEVPST